MMILKFKIIQNFIQNKMISFIKHHFNHYIKYQNINQIYIKY